MLRLGGARISAVSSRPDGLCRSSIELLEGLSGYKSTIVDSTLPNMQREQGVVYSLHRIVVCRLPLVLIKHRRIGYCCW